MIFVLFHAYQDCIAGVCLQVIKGTGVLPCPAAVYAVLRAGNGGHGQGVGGAVLQGGRWRILGRFLNGQDGGIKTIRQQIPLIRCKGGGHGVGSGIGGGGVGFGILRAVSPHIGDSGGGDTLQPLRAVVRHGVAGVSDSLILQSGGEHNGVCGGVRFGLIAGGGEGLDGQQGQCHTKCQQQAHDILPAGCFCRLHTEKLLSQIKMGTKKAGQQQSGGFQI